MIELPELETLYLEAKRQIKAKDFSSASTLLKQILEVDDGYRDASRLLASIVQKKRYRWYKDWHVWGGVVALGVLGLVVILFSQLPKNQAPAIPSPASTIGNEVVTQPTDASIIVPSPTSDPSFGGFEWKRVNSGKQIERENITSLAIYPGDMAIMYTATEYAGIYKTIDGGKSWSPIMNGLKEATFQTILVSDIDPQSVIALSAGGWIYASIDAGENWEKLWSVSFFYTPLIIQDPTNGQHLISKQKDTLVESWDFGQTWASVSSLECPAYFSDIAFGSKNNQDLTAIQSDDNSTSCPGGVYRSLDGGKTWEKSALDVENLNLVKVSGQYIYITTSASGEVYVSPDSGLSWSGPLSSISARCIALGVDPNNGQNAFCLIETNYGELTNIWATNDAGVSWHMLANLSMYGTSIILPVFSPDKMFVAGYGLLVSVDEGSNWQTIQNGLASRTFELIFDTLDNKLLYAHETHCKFKYSKLFISHDGGTKFDLITEPGISDECGLSIGYGGVLYRWQFYEYITSNDQGKTWKKWEKTIQPSFITAIGATPKVEGLLLATIFNSGTILRTNDDGESWVEVVNPSGLYDNYYFAGEKGNRVYATDFGQISRSNDAGESWTSCESPNEKLAESASNLVVDPANVDTIYIATRGEGVLKSEDGCMSLHTVNQGLEDLYVNTIAIDPNDSQRLFAGTTGGAYISLNGGDSWSQVNDGLLGATIIYSIAVNPSDSSVFASTPYGVFKLVEK